MPGQRLVFDRNPRYFRKAADGTALPYLDRVDRRDHAGSQNAELLRLEAGQIDVMTSEIAPEAYAPLKRAADAGKVKLLDLGVGYNADALWFNLKPGAFAGDPRAAWLQRDELRQAISLAVDRKLFADTVFLGAAVPVYGPETPANKTVVSGGRPSRRTIRQRRRQLLASHRPHRSQRRRAARGRAAAGRRGSRCSRRRDGRTSSEARRSSATS